MINFAKNKTDKRTRLNAEEVRSIRKNVHGMTPKKWADKLNVHYRTIEKVIYFETWRHVR